MDIKRIDSTPYFLDVFTKYTKEYPNSKMLFDDRDTSGLTRAQVDEASARVYAWLSRKGIGREDFVLICMPRGVWSIVSMIGVWKAGAALTVVEDNYAEERIAFIKKNCGCKVVIDLEAWQEINAEEPKWGYQKAELHDAAFAVYTSGSTGTPKGALHEYGNIKLNVLSAKVPAGPRTEKNSRVALIAPLNFVAATKTVLGVLYTSNSLYVIPYSISKNPIKLKKYYREEKINNTFLSPSIIRATGGDISPYLKVVHTGSEPANGIFLEGIELVNNYSMSEGAFSLCQFVIDRPYDVCPVGKPNYEDLKIHLLDSEGNEAAEGEICFENPFFRGYINMPEATAKALKGGLYHSGDLGKWDENGNLVLLGRANDMIKINGNRIEPAEIEAAFKAVTGKDWCAARGFEKPEQSFIALYYQGKPEQETEALREKMGTRLPYYMIPAYFIRVDTIPLLPNGKLNRKALPEPQVHLEQEEYAAPETETQRILCKAFEKVLNLAKVGIHDNFYHLGGDSLKAMMLLEAVDLDQLSAIDIFEGCTPEKIAAIYEEHLKESDTVDPAAADAEARKKPHTPTATQISLIDYTIFSPKQVHLNLPTMFKFPLAVDAEKLCEAYNKVIENHPIFATIFEFDEDCTLIERFAPEKMPVIHVTETTEAEFSEIKDRLVTFFKVLGESLFRGGVYKTEAAVYLFIDMHHAAADGSAYQIFFANLAKAYRGEALEADTYYTYLARDERIRASEKYEKAKAYFEETYGKDQWCISLSSDTGKRPEGKLTIMLEKSISQNDMAAFEKRTGISRNMLYTAVSLFAIAKIENTGNVMMNWVFHDRTDKIKQNAFGCICRSIPVGVNLNGDMTVRQVMDHVIQRSNESIANSCYEWSILNDTVFMNDMFMLVYETSTILSSGGIKDLGAVSEKLPVNRNAAIRRAEMLVMDTPHGIFMQLGVAPSLFSESKLERIKATFCDMLERIFSIDDFEKVRIKELLA